MLRQLRINLTESATVNKHCYSEKFELSFASGSSSAVLQVQISSAQGQDLHTNHPQLIEPLSPQTDYICFKHIREYASVIKSCNNHTESPSVTSIIIQYPDICTNTVQLSHTFRMLNILANIRDLFED